MPHLLMLLSVYLIHLVSAAPYSVMSLHISSREACFSLAVLAAMPRFSTSPRNVVNWVMHSGGGPPPPPKPPPIGGPPKPPPPPIGGAAIGCACGALLGHGACCGCACGAGALFG